MNISDPKVSGAMLVAIGRTMLAANVGPIEVMSKDYDNIRLAVFKTVLEQEDDAEQYDLSQAVYMLEEDLIVIIGGV